MRGRFLSSLVIAARACQCRGSARPVAPGADARCSPIRWPLHSGKIDPTYADGKPDLSGVWNKPYRRNSAQGVEPLPFTPAGLAKFQNVPNVVDPSSYCRSLGTPRVTNSPYPKEILQRPNRVVFVYEYMHNFRVIPTDGRAHPQEVLPSPLGHSVGRWEEDTLVIDTIGFTDRTWLDDHGNQHSEAMHLTERYRRITYDQLRYDFTIDDPKIYSKPWSNGWIIRLAPADWEVMEYSCMDNNKSLEEGHLRPGAR